MTDRTRKIIARVIAILGASLSATLFIIFSGIPGIALKIVLSFFAGTAGHFLFTWLGGWAMRLQKRLSYAPAGAAVYAFAKLPPEEGQNAGGKGRALSVLFQGGFPVPDGCVILPRAFEGDDLRPEAWRQVQAQLKRLRRGSETAFAVRSSALSEDSGEASFAGEFETVLDVRSDERILAAIRQVRASRNSQRVQAYSQAKGLQGGDQPLAVVVQVLIRADYAGVLFTADPLSGDLRRMSGNVVAGMGDALVSGQVSAEEFSFERPAGVYHGPDVLAGAAKTLHREAHQIEHVMGCPQDIEWALSGGRVYILQARPITTFNTFDPITGVWNDTRAGHFLWSATNLMEAQPRVLTPFTASLRPYLESQGGPTLSVKGYPLNGIIGGRFYANISVQVSAFAPMFKGDARRAYREMSGWWGDLPADMEIPLLPLTRQEWQETLLPELLRSMRLFTRYRKQAAAFLAENRAVCADLRARIVSAPTCEALLALWNTAICPRYVDSMIHIIAAGSDAQVRLERDLRTLVGDEDANALLSNLGGLSGRLESLGPAAGLGMVDSGEMTREEYLENYGHRGENEGEVAWPRPMEDPHWLDRQLEEWRRSPVDVDAMLARQALAWQAAWQRFTQRHPKRVKAMHKRLLEAAAAAHRREVMRSEATRGMTVLRAFALRAGELLGVGEDVFYLTIHEVLAGLGEATTGVEHIPTRKEAFQRYSDLPAYPLLISGRFEPLEWAASPNRRIDRFVAGVQAGATDVPSDDRSLRGAPGALGVVEGSVRRLDSLEDAPLLQPGEVLVTALTNIGWTPIFPRAAAIVTDLGAPLSHAAIVARELGIPAVVGCGDATRRLKTGDRVRVDGGRGLVEILE